MRCDANRIRDLGALSRSPFRRFAFGASLDSFAVRILFSFSSFFLLFFFPFFFPAREQPLATNRATRKSRVRDNRAPSHLYCFPLRFRMPRASGQYLGPYRWDVTERGEMYFSRRNRTIRQVACDIMTIFCILVISWRLVAAGEVTRALKATKLFSTRHYCVSLCRERYQSGRSLIEPF